jgi:hypothetical protein
LRRNLIGGYPGGETKLRRQLSAIIGRSAACAKYRLSTSDRSLTVPNAAAVPWRPAARRADRMCGINLGESLG